MTLSTTIHPLDTIEKQNDLGIIVDTKLFFNNHINQVVNKATEETKIIHRTFQFLDIGSFLLLYKTMVRTHLEYTIVVWCSYKEKHIVAIENVQRRATKELPGMSILTYTERVNSLKLPSLAYIRLRGDTIEVKIMLNLYYKESSDC